MAKPVAIRRPPPPAELRPYPEIVDQAKGLGLTVHLHFFHGYWTLEVMERHRVVTTARSKAAVPGVFGLLARMIWEDITDGPYTEGKRG